MSRSNVGELDARIASYEFAFRMQTEAPELVDLSERIRRHEKLYGLDDPVAEPFGRQCLLGQENGRARRPVRDGPPRRRADRWDDHGDIKSRLPKHCREVDQPVAGLLKDLKARGLLEETLVVWASEMGRTPFDNNLVTSDPGPRPQPVRLVCLDGGRRRQGRRHFRGDRRVLGPRRRGRIPVRDVHATILRLLGLDQDRLSVLHSGRFKRLTDIGGRVIDEIITAT